MRVPSVLTPGSGGGGLDGGGPGCGLALSLSARPLSPSTLDDGPTTCHLDVGGRLAEPRHAPALEKLYYVHTDRTADE